MQLNPDFTPLAQGTRHYYLDVIEGDNSNSGSQAAPFKDFSGLWPHLQGGEIVYIRNGNYPDFEMRGQISFDRWISFLPYPGHRPTLGRMSFSAWDGMGPVSLGGVHSYHLDFIGLHFSDGIEIYNVKEMQFRGCGVTLNRDLVGSVEAITMAGVDIRNSGFIHLEDCDITHTATGITVYGEDISIVDCSIHHITHDGIQLTGVKRGLVEGTVIYNADDGVDDDSGLDWNRHNDGIHVYMRGPGNTAEFENDDITLRGNTIYDINGQGIQFNNYGDQFQNRNFLVENNIFGPTAAPVFHNLSGAVPNLIFRHNSVIDFGPEGRTFRGPQGRDIQCEFYMVTFSDLSTDLQVYNNIFATDTDIPISALRRDHNVIQSSREGSTPMGWDSFVHEEPLFSSPDSMDGRLTSQALVVDSGTRLSGSGEFLPFSDNLNIDFYGNSRDNRPDIGAVEVQGNSPSLESPLVLDLGPKYTFIDDFSDGDLLMDLWLDGPGIQGIPWESDDSYNVQYSDIFDSNVLSAPMGYGQGTLLLSEQGDDWSDYTLEFKGSTYLGESDGPVLLARDKENFYWLDIAKNTGILYRVDNGVFTELAQNSSLRIGHGSIYQYKISVEHIGATVRFQVWKDGSSVLDYTDDNGMAALFDFGGVGFYRRVTAQASEHHRILVDDVKVTLTNTP